VRSIGLKVRLCDVADGFLPGLDIGDGAVLLDRLRLAYPGDILHEAGHLAVSDVKDRAAPSLDPRPGDEMAAIAWSFAALRFLDIDPATVFHDHGYKGGGASLRENFMAGRYVGVPLLAWYGMAIDPNRASPGGPEPYPHMLRWLR
jgi:hypothetical protein